MFDCLKNVTEQCLNDRWLPWCFLCSSKHACQHIFLLPFFKGKLDIENTYTHIQINTIYLVVHSKCLNVIICWVQQVKVYFKLFKPKNRQHKTCCFLFCCLFVEFRAFIVACKNWWPYWNLWLFMLSWEERRSHMMRPTCSGQSITANANSS